MAATYSAFMTTRFYSPVFNTALFDGPFRIYFSQSYESAALKIYHLLQTQHQDLWKQLKLWSHQTHEHVFLLMYPDLNDVEMIFEKKSSEDPSEAVRFEKWDEGLALGLSQPQNDQQVEAQIHHIEVLLENWIKKNQQTELTI